MDKTKRIVTFGEVMMRLTPPDHLRFNQTDRFTVNFGGSEANVAVTLARFGLNSEFITALPQNKVADACIDDMRRHGVITSNIVRMGKRMGLYFMEEASALRSSHVVYDRADSAFDSLRPGMIDWEEVFQGAAWFHWSGISAAVSVDTAAMTKEAVEAADRMGLKISCDLNYRKNLWKYGKEPEEVLPELIAHCDAMFGTDDEYRRVLKVNMPPFLACDSAYKLDKETYSEASRQVVERFPRCQTIAVGLRNVMSANHHTISGSLFTEGKLLTTRVYDIEPVLDCVGVGDAFVGGMIYSLFQGEDMQYALDFGAAACAIKNTVKGDYNQFSAQEIDELAHGSTSGRISR